MKKKKPKISPPKPPSKSSSKSPPKPPSKVNSIPLDKDYPVEDPNVVFDAQIGSQADAVAQQSSGASDLAPDLTITPAKKTVIGELSPDPSSANLLTQALQLESNFAITLQSSSTPDKDVVAALSEQLLSIMTPQLANLDAKIDSSSSHLAKNKPVVAGGVKSIAVDIQDSQVEVQQAEGFAMAAANKPITKAVENHQKEAAGRKTRRGRSKDKQKWKVVEPSLEVSTNTLSSPPPPSQTATVRSAPPALNEKEQAGMVHSEITLHSKLGTDRDKVPGESSKTPHYLRSERTRSASANTRSSQSDVQPDSSDVESSDSELEEGEASSSARLTLLRKLAVQTSIFQIWKQRNNLIHNQILLPPASVFRAIDRELRNIISARRHRKLFDSLMVMWLR
ncbi:hypothetical protein IGI04_030592 [Brassica rapa subsp. trilocularis]|uniref:Uncharacterized protein n=1 Tax=Brassica rapa subsp. trilocularis TaxID=1813537 RepID=A0ABQ7LTJ7_BRACM|nr:hypothetical protein IGI04_030592 [Brassica rapa subsp. trilocularis]